MRFIYYKIKQGYLFFLDVIFYFFLKNKAKLKNNEWGIISPFGIGDTYFICALAKSFKEKYGGKFVIIIKKEHSVIPDMFSDYVDKKIIFKYLRFSNPAKFNKLAKGKFFIGHPSVFGEKWLINNLGDNNFNLLQSYKFIFNLSLHAPLDKPKLPLIKSNCLNNIFRKHKLIEGKTVLIFTDATSTTTISLKFWQGITDLLIQNGFVVCVNTFNDKSPIDNAIPIFIPLNELIPFVEKCGNVISIRNGVCDLLSSSSTNLFIIYPKEKWYSGTIFSICSLKIMNISKTVYEYEIDENKDYILSDIIQKITK